MLKKSRKEEKERNKTAGRRADRQPYSQSVSQSVRQHVYYIHAHMRIKTNKQLKRDRQLEYCRQQMLLQIGRA